VLALGSIVECEADVIVNSANTDLIMGTGVAAAILNEAGPEVEEEAIRQGPVQVGDVVVTGPGNLAAKHILHVAVVGDVPPDIEDCTVRVLERALELAARSIALPALGTGSAGVAHSGESEHPFRAT
jgi:O-acetyl-ADP-ribose deacetylase